MTDPAHKPQETTPPIEQQQQEQQKRLCDYCSERTAVLYCRADSAKLCFSCDREVHSTNQLFCKHPRSLLCDACDASPASIFCETEQSVLCSNCDWENHSQTTLFLTPVHNRRPVESYSGCPSVSELFTIFGFDDLSDKALFLSDKDNEESNTNYFNGDELSDLFFWETPAFVSIDDLIVTGNSAHNFQAMDVPPLPKNRNAACGKHKEEIVCQLRQLAKLKPNLRNETFDFEPINGFQLLVPEQNRQPGNIYTASEHDADAEPISFPPYKDRELQWLGDPSTLSRNHFDEIPIVPEKNSENGGCARHVSDGDEERPQHRIITEKLSVYPKVGVHELNSQERDSAISRYKEKRKTRRYDKHIRYESRKVRAESRTRIKGRFAKIEQ